MLPQCFQVDRSHGAEHPAAWCCQSWKYQAATGTKAIGHAMVRNVPLRECLLQARAFPPGDKENKKGKISEGLSVERMLETWDKRVGKVQRKVSLEIDLGWGLSTGVKGWGWGKQRMLFSGYHTETNHTIQACSPLSLCIHTQWLQIPTSANVPPDVMDLCQNCIPNSKDQSVPLRSFIFFFCVIQNTASTFTIHSHAGLFSFLNA